MQDFPNDEEQHAQDSSYAVIDEIYAKNGGELRRVSLLIHGWKELAFEEHRSSQAVSQVLESQGFAVERDIAGDTTAFVATWTQGRGPVVSFNAVIIFVVLRT